MLELKQSTAVDILVGPFIDDTDGKTPETGLTVTASEVLLSKNGQALTLKSDVTSLVHDAQGFYNCEFDATDTNTLGQLDVVIFESGALMVWKQCMVLAANVYDDKYGSTIQTVNTVQISGDATAADNCELMFDGTGYAGGTAKLGVDVVAVSGDTTSADNLELDYDGTGYAKANSTVGTVTLVTTTTTNTDMLTAAAVNAEVDTALTDIHLDHLMAAAAADVVVDGSVIAHMVSATEDWSTFVPSDDSLEALRVRGDAAWTTGAGTNSHLMNTTTIATLASQVSFTLTAGSADNNAYEGCMAIVTDSATATQKAVGWCITYVGSTKTVTLHYDPAVFTMATGDTIEIYASTAFNRNVQGRALITTSASGAVQADLITVNGQATPAANLEAFYDGTGYTGGTILQDVNIQAISDDATAAANLELMYDGNGYAGGATKLQVNTVQISSDTTAANNLEAFFDGNGYDAANSTVGTVTLVTTTTTNTDMITAAAVNAEVDTALTDIHLDHLMAAAAADVVVDGSVIAHMVSATEDWSTFVPSDDSLEALRVRGDAAWTTGAGGSDRVLLQDTTIATLATQLSFTLTAGSADDDAYNGCVIVIEDVSTATQKAVGHIKDYAGSTKTVTLQADPNTAFVMAATDKVYILADTAVTALVPAQNTLAMSATGYPGIDWANIANKTTAVDLTQTDIQLCDTTTTVTNEVTADAVKISGDATAADNAELFFDGTGYDAANSTVGTVTLVDTTTAVTNEVTADAVKISGDATAADNAELFFDGTGYDAANSTVGTVTLVTTTTTNTDMLTAAAVNTECDTALVDIGLDHLVSASVTGTDVTDNSIIASLVSKEATADWDDFANTTDSLQAIRDRGDTDWITGAGGSDPTVLQSTTIATLASQTSFTLTAGATDNDSYVGCMAVIEDVSTGTQKAVGVVSAYVGSTKTVTLLYDPGIFTMAATDNIAILAFTGFNRLFANRTYLISSLTGTQDVNITQISADATAANNLELDYDGTGYAKANSTVGTVTLCDTTTTNTDMLTAAAVNTEVDTALTDIHLDHLMAAAAADVVVDGSVIAHMVSATEDWSTFVPSTESLEALRDRGDAAWTTGSGGSGNLLNTTTIATLASQTSFTLTAGSGDNNCYEGCLVVVTDASTATQKAVGWCTTYVGAGKTITLKYDPAVFTMAVGDTVECFATTAYNRDIQTIANMVVDTGGYAQVDVHKISTDTTAASNLELDYDGTGYAKTNSTMGLVTLATTTTTVTNEVTADAVKISGDSTAADNAELFFDGTGYDAANSTVGIVTLVTTTTTNTDMLTAAAVNAEVDTALTDIKLDHLVAVADADDVVDDSVLGKMASTDGDWSNFSETTDSLQSLRDNQGGATAAAVADAVWDETKTGHVTSGKAGYQLWTILDAINASFVNSGVIPASSYDATTVLGRCLKKVRQLIDEPSTGTKYSDDDLMGFMRAAWVQTMSDVNCLADNPIIARHTFTVASGTQSYVLPPVVGEILQMAKINTATDRVEWEVPIRSRHNPIGPGITLEGNVVRFDPKWAGTSEAIRVDFVPSADFSQIAATATTVTATTVLIPASVTLGSLDLRENAYAGTMMRLTSAAYDAGDTTENVLQDRIITSYDAGTRTATIEPAFSPVPSTGDGDCKFEIVPMYTSDLELTVCLTTAALLLGADGDTARMRNIKLLRQEFFRSMKIRITNYENRYGDRFEGDTWDNDNYTPWYYGSIGR